jgi:hypothetical protein
MKLLDNLKNIFKKSEKPKEITPILFKEENGKRTEVEKLLAEQLAEDQKRKHDWEEKSLSEIKEKHKERVKAKEQLTKQLAEDRKREKTYNEISKIHSETEKSVPIKYGNRIESQKKSFEEREIEELRIDKERAERTRIEQEQAEQIRLEEIKDLEQKIVEKEHRARIYQLWKDNESFRDYLIEKKKFNEIYGKNVNCDICSWNCGLDIELHNYNGQTYCTQHIPPEMHREIERKVKAGKHGASQDFIKK